MSDHDTKEFSISGWEIDAPLHMAIGIAAMLLGVGTGILIGWGIWG